MVIVDNVVPFIGGEEEKVEWEPRKMLGSVVDGEIRLAEIGISAHTNRVQVTDGHLVCLTVEFEQRATPADVRAALADYQAPEIARDLPFAPHPPFWVAAKTTARSRAGPHDLQRDDHGWSDASALTTCSSAPDGALAQHHPRRRRRLDL
jgi:aspartate-semialdehyde dehydrogenase